VSVSRTVRACALLIGLGLLVVLVARLGPAEVAAHIERAGPGAILLLVTYAAGTAIAALPWWLLLPRAARPSLGAAIASRFAAAGANALLPLFGVGGEPARLLWLAPGQRATGVAAIVLDRLLYAVASALFLLVGVLALFATTGVATHYVAAGAIAGLGLLAAAVLVAWLASRHRIAERIHGLVRRLTGRGSGVRELDGFGERVDDALERMVARRRRLWLGLGAHLVGRTVLGAEIFVGFALLDVPLSPAEALVFASVPVLLALVAGIVPSQFGVQEGGQALVAMLLGVPPSSAVAVVLLQRIRQVASVSIAWLLVSAVKRRPPAEDRGCRAAAPP
jgi:glycosyltransferase 2 family protein